MNLQSSFTYDNFGRRTSRTLQQDNTTVSTAGRSCDTFDRIASVSNGTDTMSYTYRPGGQFEDKNLPAFFTSPPHEKSRRQRRRLSEAQYKSKHINPPEAATSQVKH